ncbi:MlaD family protein [Flavobacterium chilense]|uniref:Phospholipid/cholesterol/gamma-HCH transport system substrate-binding protein n=1 Tax=Flavobacterium chilense TaxID=946677 RepID=A0A1M7A219_9FLAO|nr:MlaD family protein [Flavobacterium chilense]SHL36726.1 phospholipid/cholesterol/gamma-HCH transport system substrate-binding protein [Flavobacterium chilense]
MKKKSDYIWKLGLFVIAALTIFLVAVYFIGKSQNLFGDTFHLKAKFKNVSGLKNGNNVLLSGITIGTIKDISFISDSTVVVDIIIREEVHQYIKTDAWASIGSDGLMGDKVLTISPKNSLAQVVKDGDMIASNEAVGMEDLIAGLKKSVDNAQIITKQLSEFSYKINNGKGALSKVLTDENFANSIDLTMKNLKESSNEFAVFTKKINDKDGTLSKLMTDPYYANSVKKTLSGFEKSVTDLNVFTSKLNTGKGILPKLISDEKLSNSLDSTLTNLQTASKNLIEIEQAAKQNFLLRGYFKKKKKQEVKKEIELQKAVSTN